METIDFSTVMKENIGVVEELVNLNKVLRSKGMATSWDSKDIGIYHINNTVIREGTAPEGSYGYGLLVVYSVDNVISQVYYPDYGATIYTRLCYKSEKFRPWVKFMTNK